MDGGSTNDRTAQLVLLCSWRTVKDACLLVGEICARFGGGLSETTLVGLSEHFVRQLSDITHRGAFEQAYVGFCQVMTAMWTRPELRGIPEKWGHNI